MEADHDAAAHSDRLSEPSPDIVSNDARSTPSARLAALRTAFSSREELLAYITSYSLDHGFAVVIHKSNLPRGQLWLRCDMGGSSRNTVPTSHAKRKRKASPRLQNCPYQVYARRTADNAWLLRVQNEEHNHSLADGQVALTAHPSARRLTNAQKRLVMEMTDIGIRPAVIVERLKAFFPDKPIKVQDIYNARNYIRKERAAGRSPYPELLDQESNGQESSAGNGSPVCVQPAAVAATRDDNLLDQVMNSITGTVPTWPQSTQTNFILELQSLLARYVESQDQQLHDGLNSSDQVGPVATTGVMANDLVTTAAEQ